MNAPLLTARQVADRVGLSPETVLRKWRRGEIPGYRLASNCLRFEPAAVDAWLDGLRAGTATNTLKAPLRFESGGQGARRHFAGEGERPDKEEA